MDVDDIEAVKGGSSAALGVDASAIKALLEDGQPLHRHPGPVLLIDRDRNVLAANVAGLAIAHGLTTATTPRVAALIEAAFADASGPQGQRVSDENTGTTTDLTASPLDGGAHLLVIGADVSLDNNLRAALVESRQRYKDLVEISSDFTWETGESGTFVFVSPGGALGYTADELVGHEAAGFAELPEGVDVDLPFTTRRPMYGVEFRFRRPDGSVADLIASALPLLDEQGVWRGVRGVCRDVTKELARDAALAGAQNRERLMGYIVRAIRDEIEPSAMLETATIAIARALSVDGCQILRSDSRGGVRQGGGFGAPPADPLVDLDPSSQGPVFATVAANRTVAHVTRYHHTTNGAIVLWRVSPGAPWEDTEIRLLGSVAGQVGIALQQIAAHERLEELSTTDPLTGLLNRRTFTERVRLKVEPQDGAGTSAGALAYVDLDNFKSVNDELGHQAGDRALIAVAGKLRAMVRQDDLVARLGGDEFAFWLEGADVALAEDRAYDLMADATLFAPFATDPERPLGMSIGLAAFDPESGETLEQLIARADAAMYEVKHSGKSALVVAPVAVVKGNVEV
ncbi:MAG: diguanylate cyclase, partial [Proteobacteria bacterium]|nr:diguanylate cyclase [Pseudomonadota bacterium]